MKVYVLTEDVDYIGSTNLGVFASRESAEEYCKQLKPLSHTYYDVEEWEVNENE